MGQTVHAAAPPGLGAMEPAAHAICALLFGAGT
jgi:hypothetical protein